jgi:hypothetical protein
MSQKETDDFLGRLSGKGNRANDYDLKGGNESQKRAEAFCGRLAGKLPQERASVTLPAVKESPKRTSVFRENVGRKTGRA